MSEASLNRFLFCSIRWCTYFKIFEIGVYRFLHSNSWSTCTTYRTFTTPVFLFVIAYCSQHIWQWNGNDIPTYWHHCVTTGCTDSSTYPLSMNFRYIQGGTKNRDSQCGPNLTKFTDITRYSNFLGVKYIKISQFRWMFFDWQAFFLNNGQITIMTLLYMVQVRNKHTHTHTHTHTTHTHTHTHTHKHTHKHTHRQLRNHHTQTYRNSTADFWLRITLSRM